MLKLLVVAAVLVASVSASSPCCGPSQYMGVQEILVGQVFPGQEPIGANILQVGAWDYKNRRFGFVMIEISGNSPPYPYKLIQDYGKATQWIIDEGNKTCTKLITTPPEPTVCIPDDATFSGRVSIGGNGTDSIIADIWSKIYHEGTNTASQSITVRHKDCFPIRSQFMGTNNEMGAPYPRILSSGWFNITIGIPKPDDWFTVPSYCNQQEIVSAKTAIPRYMSELYFQKFF
eukprot:XP_003723598.1 PREDICTED: development-specific protein LVN1.2 isoform X1 [Strongylocentrotus purpuratus]